MHVLISELQSIYRSVKTNSFQYDSHFWITICNDTVIELFGDSPLEGQSMWDFASITLGCAKRLFFIELFGWQMQSTRLLIAWQRLAYVFGLCSDEFM